MPGTARPGPRLGRLPMHQRSHLVVVAMLATIVGAVAGLAWSAAPVATPPAHGQESLIESDPAVVRARADLEAAQAAAHAAEAKLEATTEQRADVERRIADAQQRIAELDQQRIELAQQRDELLDHLRERAAALYAVGGDGTGVADLLAGSALDGARRKRLGDAAARSDHDTARQLDATRATLSTTQATLRAQQSDLEEQQRELDGLLSSLQAQQAAVDQQVTAANGALERARAVGALHAAGEPIVGPATLTADQMVTWFDRQGYHPRLSNTTVPELAQLFLEEGGDEHVRGDLAFAQAVVETGGFSSAPDNNYSGLGWCDTCARGTVFPTPRDGIRAQIQLLLNYADPGSRAAELHHPPSPYWWAADPGAAARAFDTYFAKGWAPTWSDMGHGNWATDPSYSGKVIAVYRSMVASVQGA